MLHIPCNNKDYYLPENFNELTGAQLLQLAQLMLEKTEDQRLKLLHVLLDIRLYDFFRIPAAYKAGMLDLIDWVFKENTLTAQLLPFYKGYHGPKSEFDNLLLGEFHFSEMYYRELATGDVAAVDKLIAVLYRLPVDNYDFEKDTAGDARQPFNANETAYYARQIKDWPASVKTAIVMWYDGCRQHMVGLYDEVFSSPSNDHTEDSLGMYGVIRNLSGERFGTINQVEHVHVHTAFTEIEELMKENREAAAAAKKS